MLGAKIEKAYEVSAMYGLINTINKCKMSFRFLITMSTTNIMLLFDSD